MSQTDTKRTKKHQIYSFFIQIVYNFRGFSWVRGFKRSDEKTSYAVHLFEEKGTVFASKSFHNGGFLFCFQPCLILSTFENFLLLNC